MNKGFTGSNANIETPNDIGVTEKPLKPERITPNRVDINVLKSKLQETESKEFKKAKGRAFKEPSFRGGGAMLCRACF